MNSLKISLKQSQLINSFLNIPSNEQEEYLRQLYNSGKINNYQMLQKLFNGKSNSSQEQKMNPSQEQKMNLKQENEMLKFLIKTPEEQQKQLNSLAQSTNMNTYILLHSLLHVKSNEKATPPRIPLGWELVNVWGDGRCGFYALDTVIRGYKPEIKNYGYGLIEFTLHKIDEYIVTVNDSKENKKVLIDIANFLGCKYNINNSSNQIYKSIHTYLSRSKEDIIKTRGPNGINSKCQALPLDRLKIISRVLDKNIYVFNGDVNVTKWYKYGNQEPYKNNALFIYYNGDSHFQAMMVKEGWKLKNIFDEHLTIDDLGTSEYIFNNNDNNGKIFLNINNSRELMVKKIQPPPPPPRPPRINGKKQSLSTGQSSAELVVHLPPSRINSKKQSLSTGQSPSENIPLRNIPLTKSIVNSTFKTLQWRAEQRKFGWTNEKLNNKLASFK